jgi:hypothetical protein
MKQALAPAFRPCRPPGQTTISAMIDVAQCVSRSCTTGWLDWVHGELWCSPTGLVRLRLSWRESRAHGIGPTVQAPLPTTTFGPADLRAVLAAHPTNKVIHFQDVAGACLIKGTTTDALELTLRDGGRHKLLWLRRDPAYGVLAEALPVALGDRLGR